MGKAEQSPDVMLSAVTLTPVLVQGLHGVTAELLGSLQCRDIFPNRAWVPSKVWERSWHGLWGFTQALIWEVCSY